MVIMREEMLPNNLYKLLEDTISGRAVISTPENSEYDLAYLWHICLGNMSERAWRSCTRGNYRRTWSLESWTFANIVYLKIKPISLSRLRKRRTTRKGFSIIFTLIWGVGTDKISWWYSLLCHIHGWLFMEELGLLHVGEIWSLCEV